MTGVHTFTCVTPRLAIQAVRLAAKLASCCILAWLAAVRPAATQEVAPQVNLGPTPSAPDKDGYTLFDPTPDGQLRAFATDRPTRSNSPITVDAGQFQYETDLVNYTHSNVGGSSSRLYTAFDPTVKVGVTNSLDLEVQFGGYEWLQVSHPVPGGAAQPVQGVGDLTLRAKLNLFGNEGGVAMALIPYVKIPTAAQAIGDGHTDGGIIAPVSFPLPWSFTLLVMSEIDVLANTADAGHHFNFTQLVNISHPIGKSFTVYGELYSALGTDARKPPEYAYDTAVAYALTATLQLDLGGSVGLNRDTPNLMAYAGLSQRF